ncbi:MAG: aminopeptidase P N-terminal domain-containing protein, partial [Phaeodactylibacter sp.]|nr:aminopeptidase P N-terminal domain-containing protein [Phaeodactylibacter sp.]
MFAKEIYARRRQSLLALVEEGLIVLMGNQEVGMNYTANPYPFRQDSSFLYYFGIQRPGLAATLDAGTGDITLYG